MKRTSSMGLIALGFGLFGYALAGGGMVDEDKARQHILYICAELTRLALSVAA